MTNQYTIGNSIRMSVVVTVTATGVAIDPDNLTVEIRNETTDALVTLRYGTDAAVVKDSTGHYHADYTPAAAGEYHYRFSSTGTYPVAVEGDFDIPTSEVVP